MKKPLALLGALPLVLLLAACGSSAKDGDDTTSVVASFYPFAFVAEQVGGTHVDVENLTSPIDQLAAELFQDPEAVFRFDGSDLMPGEIGAGALWTELTNWIANEKPTQQVLTDIENAWPAS